MSEAYCVKCGRSVSIKGAKSVRMKNGRPATKRPSLFGLHPPRFRRGPNPYGVKIKPAKKARKVAPKRKVLPLGGLFHHSPGWEEKHPKKSEAQKEGEKRAKRLAKLQREDRKATEKREKKLYGNR